MTSRWPSKTLFSSSSPGSARRSTIAPDHDSRGVSRSGACGTGARAAVRASVVYGLQVDVVPELRAVEDYIELRGEQVGQRRDRQAGDRGGIGHAARISSLRWSLQSSSPDKAPLRARIRGPARRRCGRRRAPRHSRASCEESAERKGEVAQRPGARGYVLAVDHPPGDRHGAIGQTQIGGMCARAEQTPELRRDARRRRTVVGRGPRQGSEQLRLGRGKCHASARQRNALPRATASSVTIRPNLDLSLPSA